jgi:hypothetical protein
MGKIGTLIEEASGLVSFWVGLLFLFVAGEMAFSIRHQAELILAAVTAIWSVALLVTSRCAGRHVVLFRIGSVLVLLIGTSLAAVFLPWKRM